MNFGLDARTLSRVEAVFLTFPDVEEVVVYGSRAMGMSREGSDIDITLIGKNLSAAHRKALWLALDDLNLPYTIDLSLLSEIQSAPLRAHIERVGKCFYARDKQQSPPTM